ncbi:MAG: glycoside hydrolase family 3 C-terminal domain-containing protein [Dictyoglomaceae bacterium]|nr:glycoside hydrolase family 3 C-terminal domain-containing protein [Dictyoglomaceae bacterium]HPP15917.1 glycoside hydrolase family 3 C-terminal domain-containing protein [Dictyoglomaceae bacterium]HPU43130.1 glycoside hydrolase family 3 C-terminal domain-containing protein [Dictyoglomaceae bacterium]
MERDLKKLISQMTLEEKASLCSGKDAWCTKPIERLGIPSIRMSDGPHGLRKAGEMFDKSVPATCFPTAVTLASSWDIDLLEKVGRAIGEECQAEDVQIILGPGVNIKRSPLCGRNFEYYSEDPLLSSELAAHFIKGVQSQGVGTSIKHFCANNQEHRRLTVNAIVDERTLREIYLASFEKAVKEAKPWTVMCSYNKLNGEYCSENKYTLTDILKNEWGFEGFVVSDWGAVNDRPKGLEAGLDLQMPYDGGNGDKKIIEAVKSGKLSEEALNKAVERILRIVFKAIENKKENATYDKEAHHQLAREIARECFVLLKNDDKILPLKKEGTIALIGAFAKKPRFQGGGSSHVNPTKVDSAYDEILKIVNGKANILYADGYSLDKDDIDESLIEEAKEIAKKADVVVVFAGLPERYESEGYDRVHMRMPESHNRLIENVAKVNPKVAVVLSNGSPIEMPWVDKVKGILETYLGGQAWGGAVADVLFGVVNPSGKLAESFPKKLSDNPSYLFFPGEDDRVEYREGIFVGYRYYDKKEIDPLFPFGYGLSYTTFEYLGLSLDKKEITDQEVLKVKVKVKNTGNVKGKEIIQLYVRDIKSDVIRPEKELKGFAKVELEPGEEKEVVFELSKRAFAYYNVDIKDWYVETGEFEILIGKSSRDIVLRDKVFVKSTTKIKKHYHINSTVGDIMEDPVASEKFKALMQQFVNMFPGSSEESLMDFAEMMRYMPLRSLIGFGGGKFTEEMVQNLLNELNKD